MVGSGSSTAVVLIIYRPGTAAITDVFLTELTKYLEAIALYKCQIASASDFNINVDNDAAACRLLRASKQF